jgi:hypothetical protein
MVQRERLERLAAFLQASGAPKVRSTFGKAMDEGARKGSLLSVVVPDLDKPLSECSLLEVGALAVEYYKDAEFLREIYAEAIANAPKRGRKAKHPRRKARQ